MRRPRILFATVTIFLLILAICAVCAVVVYIRRTSNINFIQNGQQQAKNLASGDYTFDLNISGTSRRYVLHVPSSYNSNTPTPLILAFHGGGGTAENMAENYNLVAKSDKEGFIIAFPNGASRFPGGKLATWNAGNCCAYAHESNSDDVDFVRTVISDIKSKLNISKIFATGMSNGGMFSYRLACDMADTFTAIASVAGTDNYPPCNPSKPISILHIHAQDDTHVLFNGGCGPDCMVKDETEFVSVPNTISKWVERNHCDETPKRVLEKEGAICDLYSNCANGVEVKLCVTSEGGHSWPGAPKNSANPNESKPNPSQAISATDEMWEFFRNK